MGSLVQPPEAIDVIPDGSSVFVGGFIIHNNPWALSTALARNPPAELTLIGYGMMSIDLLVAADAATKLIGSVNSFEPKFGQPPSVLRALDDGDLELESESGNITASRLTAGAFGIPYIPSHSVLGSDMLPGLQESGAVLVGEDPFTGEKILNVRAMNPDYALVHGARADEDGNVQLFGPTAFTDEAVYAADSVIASVEQVVSEEVIRRSSGSTIVPSYKVEHVVEAPFGAYPTSLFRYYDHDEAHIGQYADMAGTEAGVEEYFDRYVHDCDHEAFLETVGIGTLSELRADPYYGY